jgi:hypothetical protein
MIYGCEFLALPRRGAAEKKWLAGESLPASLAPLELPRLPATS